MRVIPFGPGGGARKASLVPTPTGVTSPMPVMTTRSMTRICENFGLAARPEGPTDAALPLLLSVLLDVVDRVLHGPDLLGVLVGDVDFERLFEREHELDQTERVGAEVVDEARLGLDVLLVDVELLSDDPLDLAGDVGSHG